MLTLQETANRIGEQMRALHAECAKVSTSLGNQAAELHNTLAIGFVTHLEPLGANWDEAAGATAAPKGGAHTNAGVKTKPTVNGDE